MESAQDSAWSTFWEERGRSYPDDDPIAIDGWDYGISQMGLEQAESLRAQVAEALSLNSQSKVLEVGCGAGMFLAPLSEAVGSIVGCDLSQSMLIRARRINNKLQVQVAEASHLPYLADEFDAILVYSVFHYFPSYEYALDTLNELYRVCRSGGRIWLGDVPDKSKRQEALSHRERLMKQSTPRWPWPDIGPLEQRFYDQAFFMTFAERTGSNYRFVRQSVEGYVQGQYRYNVLLEKVSA